MCLPDLVTVLNEPIPTVLVTNVGQCVSGDIRHPLVEADSLYIEDGRIAQIGHGLEFDADIVIDARGATVLPGLIDAHSHPTFGEFCPPQHATRWLYQYLHGGVTAVVSAGEVHLPGLPLAQLTPRIVRYLAVLAKITYDNQRPSGVKVHAGCPLMCAGIPESDFDEYAEAGMKLIKFAFYDFDLSTAETEAQRYSEWAHARGMRVKLHSGGVSRSGVTRPANWDVVSWLQPDIVGHVNGGPIPMPEEDMLRIVHETDMFVEYVTAGSERLGSVLFQAAAKAGAKDRIVIGTDTPSGTGITPRAMLKNLLVGASMSDLTAAEVVCMASGNVARAHQVEGGFIATGQPADLIVCDAIRGSVAGDALASIKQGDLPGVGVVLIDGRLMVAPRSEQTPPPARIPAISRRKKAA
jgi:enamidase